MALGKGIPVINGFDLNSKLPLDSRTVADTKENMNKLVTDGSVGDGQLCYCKADKKLYVLKDNVWSEVGGGGGGKSVPPTLNLLDLGAGKVRTTITEEEKTNLENGLYNQVIYATGDNFLPMYSPSKLFNVDGEYGFAQFKIFENADRTLSYSSMVINLITIGEKNTSNEYPITVSEEYIVNPPSASGGSSKIWYELPSLFFLENITQKQFDEIKNLALQNQLAGINCAGLYCPLTVYNDGQNITFFYPWYENDIFTAYLIILNKDLSVKKTPYSTITLPQTAPTSQLIPSITTTNKQQNLTIGNGLEIKDGALKTTIPPLPADASSKTYTLKAVNGVLTWVEG